MLEWKSRTRAALIHLSGSALAAALAAALVFLLWFPHPFDVVAGGAGLFVLIVSVDVVLGPLLTFAVFNSVKPWAELRRDLGIIVVMQVAALGYGLHTMYVARPVAMALEGNRFRVVTAVDVLLDELPQAPEGLRKLPITGPRMLRTADATAGDEKLRAIELALHGFDLGTRPRYWRPWDDIARNEARSAARPWDELIARYSQRRTELDAVRARTGVPAEHLRYLPVISRFAEMVALIDARSGEVVGYAPFEG